MLTHIADQAGHVLKNQAADGAAGVYAHDAPSIVSGRRSLPSYQ